jgi:hypothetical protein
VEVFDGEEQCGSILVAIRSDEGSAQHREHRLREASALLPNARRALDWIDRFGDRDGDGFVEYHRTSDKGLVNQGWKDSGDGVPYPDGTLPEPPISKLISVEGEPLQVVIEL